ncbi:MAG: prenyltransferase [Kiritimatiellia bacterium]
MKAEVVKAWFFLFRPWSYTATLVPFLVAAGIADFGGKWGHWAGGLVVGVLFQATVNLLNTWGDERSGVDDVPGAIRTTPQVHDGLVSMRGLLAVALACAGVASALGVGLCFYRDGGAWRFNWALLAAGFIGCLGSVNYSTGIKFKYHGLGVPFVSVLMGPLEIFVALALLQPQLAGQVGALLRSPLDLLFLLFLTLPVAALVGVILHGNDMRDIPTDRAAGIVTLASWLGPRRALWYYRACHLAPYAVCLALVALNVRARVAAGAGVEAASCAFLLPFFCLPLSLRTLRAAAGVYRACPANPPWRGLERDSGKILLAFGVLYTLSFAVTLVFGAGS